MLFGRLLLLTRLILARFSVGRLLILLHFLSGLSFLTYSFTY